MIEQQHRGGYPQLRDLPDRETRCLYRIFIFGRAHGGVSDAHWCAAGAVQVEFFVDEGLARRSRTKVSHEVSPLRLGLAP